MLKYDKLSAKIKNNPKNVDFDIIKKILENNGYECFNTGGSHYVFRKDNELPITIPYDRPIKVIYVKKVLELIGA